MYDFFRVFGRIEIRTRKFETPKPSHCYRPKTFPHISQKVDKNLLTATFSLIRSNKEKQNYRKYVILIHFCIIVHKKWTAADKQRRF